MKFINADETEFEPSVQELLEMGGVRVPLSRRGPLHEDLGDYAFVDPKMDLEELMSECTRRIERLPLKWSNRVVLEVMAAFFKKGA